MPEVTQALIIGFNVGLVVALAGAIWWLRRETRREIEKQRTRHAHD